jgi:cytochrome o ubiquinol oxidase subunit 2
MSSFWIPHLGGMLYAMTGHVNRLNLVADTLGAYEGSAAEINGAGLAGMRFTTRVGEQTDFDQWVRLTAQSANELNASEYEKLLQPSENDQPAFYRSPTPDLFSTVLNKYAGSHQHPAEYTE